MITQLEPRSPQAPDVEKLTRICPKCGIEILGPLPE
jgi:hypothetical protein